MDFKDKNIEKAVNLLAESRKVGRKEAIDEVLKLIQTTWENILDSTKTGDTHIAELKFDFQDLKKEVEKLKETK